MPSDYPRSPDRVRKERELLAAVQKSRECFEFAKLEYERLLEIHKSAPPDSRDAALALKAAWRIYDDALKRHREALSAFADFVMEQQNSG